ncbi:hypothetical protein V1282_003535 [Nitrobacteraceae bacterium AZCC 2146]
MDIIGICDDLHSTPSLELRAKIDDLPTSTAAAVIAPYKVRFGNHAHDIVIRMLEDRKREAAPL